MADNSFNTIIKAVSPFVIEDVTSGASAQFIFAATAGLPALSIAPTGYAGAGVAPTINLAIDSGAGLSEIDLTADNILLSANGTAILESGDGTLLDVSNGSVVFNDGNSLFNFSLTAAGAVFSVPVQAAGFLSADASPGISGTFTTAALVGKTVTFKNGLITAFA